MSNLMENQKEKAETIMESELLGHKIKRIKIGKIRQIMRKELEQLEIIRIDEVKNLEEIEMEIVILKGKLIIERKKNDLEEYEMEQLEVEVKAETELLKKDEKK